MRRSHHGDRRLEGALTVVRLIPVVNCIKLLNWETHLPMGTPVEAWALRMCDRGAERLAAPLPGLSRLCLDGHEITAVTRSGRIAIRLHYETPQIERRRAAERVFQAIVDAVRRP